MSAAARLLAAVDALLPEAERLFSDIGARTADSVGITRASYGDGETLAWEAMAEAGRTAGLVVGRDAAANLLMRRAGAAPAGFGVAAGSHLDSVPKGGNFDGLAGVIGAWLAAAALARAGIATRHDVTVFGFRGEESAWFGVHHIGARAALGAFDAAELESARRFDTGRTLAEHIAECGGDPEALRAGVRTVDPAAVRAYVELHIEQGPVLVHEGLPVGIVAGIRGNMRARSARAVGEYAHSGAVPRAMRRDASLAVAELMVAAEAEWERLEGEGRDLVLTFGKVHTDPEHHTHNKVPGRMDFVVDARSHEKDTLDRVEAHLGDLANRISAKRGVDLALGPVSRVVPAPMAPEVRAVMRRAADDLGVAALDMASGGGHDAGDFANAGTPAGMVFVRNPGGSHNPDEAMAFEDFALAAKVLAVTMMELAEPL